MKKAEQQMRYLDSTRVLLVCLIACSGGVQSTLLAAEEGQDFSFFESKIRPILIEHCYDCHSTETERSGGLGLDSRQATLDGGDLGPAVVPGSSQTSLLVRAISYDDPQLQMPPDGKLSDEVIRDFRQWIDDGALDPRRQSSYPQQSEHRDESATAVTHWAYQPLPAAEESEIGFDLPAGSGVDFWVDRGLDENRFQAAEVAEASVLARRLYYDLTGLPPTPSQLREFLSEPPADRLERLIETLLASHHYGEAQARRWMDVVRYADSITLRGFILPEAWRYRDYLIAAYNQDRSLQEMIREQVAGDLLDADSLERRQQQLVATGFLALGNTNLEQQDKSQLEMDYIDEQLDVLGNAFLGQTISCARCHDHKFDPIPTRDYYALAGIFRSSAGLDHANVSQWFDLPLPLPEHEEARFVQLAERQQELRQEISRVKKQLEKIGVSDQRYFSIDQFPGIVLDNRQAMLVGNWTSSRHTFPIIGQDYFHDGNEQQGEKSATFEPQELSPGVYEVRLAYQSGGNRASNVPIKIFSADGEKEVLINQRQKPPEQGLWISLGTYRFEKAGQAIVLITNSGADGHVIVDAVQFLPKEAELASARETPNGDQRQPSDGLAEKETSLRDRLKACERELSEISREIDARPKYLSIKESGSQTELPIHIRGSVHHLGETVPRGFLSAIQTVPTVSNPDRLDLANWIADPQNPLTARVYANRIWQQLMGRGIVETPNNFGTTGASPTHPELLDWLAGRLIESGWSTKALIREIVSSRAYQRAQAARDQRALATDPDNRFYWRGQLRRISVESIRDAMLTVSGELDTLQGGSSIRSGTKTDYDYRHASTRRSIYQPIFRNSLPELYEAFDFADPSVSIGKRSRTTVAQQGLSLMNDPWVRARADAAALSYDILVREIGGEAALQELYLACFARLPSERELEISRQMLEIDGSGDRVSALGSLIQTLFSSIDFRFLD
jgi:hypothetical protein